MRDIDGRPPIANVTIGGLLLDLGPEVGVLAVNAEDLESILGILAGSIRNQVKQKFEDGITAEGCDR